MSKKFAFTALLLAGALQNHAGALDLSPRELIIERDAPSVKRYFFQDGDKRLAFRIDPDTAVSGGGDSVAFQFGDSQNALMTIRRSRMGPQNPFDEQNLRTYRAAARELFPAMVNDVQLVEEKPNAISINEWTSYQFVFVYKVYGSVYRRTITFLNYSEREQFIVDVAAPAQEFDRIYARGYSVINSLTEYKVGAFGST